MNVSLIGLFKRVAEIAKRTVLLVAVRLAGGLSSLGGSHVTVYTSVLIEPDSSIHVHVGQVKGAATRTSSKYRNIDTRLDLPSLSTVQPLLILPPLAGDRGLASAKPTLGTALTAYSTISLKHLPHSPVRALPWCSMHCHL